MLITLLVSIKFLLPLTCTFFLYLMVTYIFNKVSEETAFYDYVKYEDSV